MLINQPTLDTAISGGVATIPLVRGDVIGSVAIAVDNGNANTTIYTVPENSYFEGYIVMHNGSSNVYLTVNGITMPMFNNTTYGNRAIPVNFYAGDVIGCSSASYWNFMGLLRKA